MSANSQDAVDSVVQDTVRFEINLDSNFPELLVRNSGAWNSYTITDEIGDTFDYETLELDLNNDGVEELILRWSNSVYGSGGGMKNGGVQVWDLEKESKLLDEITLCAEESFGRHGATAYNIECRVSISFSDTSIHVAPRTCNASYESHNRESDLEQHCRLTDMQAGEYRWVYEAFRRKED